MLTPADIISAKLIVQLGVLTGDEVRAALQAADADQDVSLDLVARLADGGWLQPEQVKRVRRYVAMFDHVRREAVSLRLVEQRRPPLSRQDVAELIARIERDRYRRRLLAVLVDAGKLGLGEASDIDRRARERVLRDDLKVLERYRQERFAGVARPLVPRAVVTTDVFKVSTLFRGQETIRFVKKALLRLEAEAVDRTALLEFVPVELSAPRLPEAEEEEGGPEEGAPEEGGSEEEEAAHLETARFRLDAEPEPEGELGEREQIGSYHVVECLGQGGMGAVYLAQEDGMGPMVAVKVMLAARAAADDLARFEREAKICAMLRHPNVVHLIEEGTTPDGLRFMAIPFFVGRDLKAVLEEKGVLHPAFAFQLFEPLLAGLESIHRVGVVHRDLKPENVFVLSGTQEVKLVDFGIARLLDADKPPEERLFESKAGVISGSPAYIAPETVSGSPLDARTDIYSAGIMLYKMLTGRLPLFAETPYDYLREHLVGVPLTLFQGKKDARWASGLEELVAQMLAKEPDDRPPSCQVILDRLQGGLRDEVIQLYDSPPPAEPEQKSLFNSFFKMFR